MVLVNMKEKFFIVVQGNPYKGEFKGQHTQMRGEGRWELNLALNLARHGHPVSILGFKWGDTSKYPLPENITLEQTGWEIFGGNCDVFFKAGWEDCKEPMIYRNVKAKIYIHGWYGSPKSSSFLNFHKQHKFSTKNHYMAGLDKSYEDFPRDMYIYSPIPIIEKIKDSPNINSNKVLLANKGVFSGDYLYVSLKMLEWIIQNPKYQYTILFYDDIEKRLKEQMMHYIIEKLHTPKIRLINGGLSHEEYIKELVDSIFLLDQPILHPQTAEAISAGCTPIFLGHEDTERINAFKVINVDHDKQLRFLEGKIDIIEYYNLLKNLIIDQQYDNAYQILMKEIQDKVII